MSLHPRHPRPWVICALLPRHVGCFFVTNAFRRPPHDEAPCGPRLRRGRRPPSRASSSWSSTHSRAWPQGLWKSASRSRRRAPRAEAYSTDRAVQGTSRRTASTDAAARSNSSSTRATTPSAPFWKWTWKTALAAVMSSTGRVRMTAARGRLAQGRVEETCTSPHLEVCFLGNTGLRASAPTCCRRSFPASSRLPAGLTFCGRARARVARRRCDAPSCGRQRLRVRRVLGKLLPWFVFYVVLGLCWVFGLAGRARLDGRRLVRRLDRRHGDAHRGHVRDRHPLHGRLAQLADRRLGAHLFAAPSFRSPGFCLSARVDDAGRRLLRAAPARSRTTWPSRASAGS